MMFLLICMAEICDKLINSLFAARVQLLMAIINTYLFMSEVFYKKMFWTDQIKHVCSILWRENVLKKRKKNSPNSSPNLSW